MATKVYERVLELLEAEAGWRDPGAAERARSYLTRPAFVAASRLP